jgi:hypothetical protein
MASRLVALAVDQAAAHGQQHNQNQMQGIISFEIRDRSFGHQRLVDFILGVGGARLPS